MKKLAIFPIAVLLFAGIVWAQDEEFRKHVLHELGGPFFVSRDNVQEDLKLSDDQKQALAKRLSDDIQEAGKTLEKVKGLKGGEREKAMQPTYQRLEVFLKENLTAEQFKRFEQLKLQYDMPGIMLRPEVAKELDISDDQRRQFMGAIEDMQKEVAPLMKSVKSGGNPEEIKAKVIKMRLDCQGKIEALLSDAQREKWKEMIGKPLVIW